MGLLYRLGDVATTDRLRAVSLVVTPGLLLDVFTLGFFGTVFPNMALASAPYFGSWLFLAYGFALTIGLWMGRHQRTNV